MATSVINIVDSSSPKFCAFACELSIRAYEPANDIIPWLANLGACSARVFSTESAFGFVARLNGIQYIAFRGSTKQKSDWFSNFDCLMTKWFCGRVHRGFLKSLQTLERNSEVLLSQLDRSLPIFLAGHSRGGAIATLAAAGLRKLGFSPSALYTFGQPRVGGLSFLRWWQKNMADTYVYRFARFDDPVPSIPPVPFYRHISDACIFGLPDWMTGNSQNHPTTEQETSQQEMLRMMRALNDVAETEYPKLVTQRVNRRRTKP